MKILHLNLKKRWFDLIAKGIKREEYREIKPYWHIRFEKEYDAILFRNGYQKDAPELLMELKDITKGYGVIEWGAKKDKEVYILELGDEINRANIINRGNK